ncbi:hypothetical protein BHM03_00013628 [Ensete ventricosum]|nr:hypothetical protein BHM03_00013628 [Ensete ventricosum]
MLPLRFPNSGNRAKVARRRGGQPQPAPMQGRPPTARSRLRPPARGWPTATRANLQGRPAPLAGAAAHKGCWRRSQGQPPASTPAYIAAHTKGAGCRAPARGCYPRLALPLAGATASAARVTAPWQGGYRRARAAVAYAGAAAATAARWGKRG